MKKEIRTVCYDDDLHLEAYRFEGIVQPFPNHFIVMESVIVKAREQK